MKPGTFIISLFLGILVMPGLLYAETFMPLPESYQTGHPVRILVVPGHDHEFSGAVFNTIKEADMNIIMADALAFELRKDPLIQVTVARTKEAYLPELAKFFIDAEQRVTAFVTKQKKSFTTAIEKGEIIEVAQVPHGDAPQKAAYQLYATNVWADEQDFDLIIHVHFNDYGSRTKETGEFNGYSIYVPDTILPNHGPSKTIGNFIGYKLNGILHSTNAPSEITKANMYGVIEDSKLIALGSYRTLHTPSVLVEYSYIYEPHVNDQLLPETAKILARATRMGIYEYVSNRASGRIIKHQWNTALKTSNDITSDVLLLQFALSEINLYPPVGKTRDDCPITGIFGPCTEIAVKEFQKKHQLAADGMVGPATRATLNSVFK